MKNSMIGKVNAVPFSRFAYITFVGNFIIAAPIVIAIMLLDVIKLKLLLFILLPIALITIPITAALSWLMAKGSNWVNTTPALITAYGVPWRTYVFLFGASLGYKVFGTTGGIVLAILLFLGATVITVPLGKFLIRWIAPELVPHSG